MDNSDTVQASLSNPLASVPGQDGLNNILATESQVPSTSKLTALGSYRDPLLDSKIVPVAVTGVNLENTLTGNALGLNPTADLNSQTEETSPVLDGVDPLLGTSAMVNSDLNLESGVFTVGNTGEVKIDFLFDGGGYQGELALFNLAGMENLEPGSPEFIQEAALRALSDSPLGYIAISDRIEGGRFRGELGERDRNQGDYQGVKRFNLTPGDEFALMLVPNGTVQQVFEQPTIGGSVRPLFSLATANPNDGLHLGQIADVTGDGHTFVMEDLRVDGRSDQDYNDFIFSVRGATGQTVLLDAVIEPTQDWRTTELGEALVDYVTIDQDSQPQGAITDELSDVVRSAVESSTDLDNYDPATLAETQEWVVGITPGYPHPQLATLFGVENLGETTYIPHTYIWQFPGTMTPEQVGQQLQELGGIEFAYPLVPVELVPQGNDPLFGHQWHLQNTGQTGSLPGFDGNVIPVWESDIHGNGVVIGIVDDGLQHTHPDLVENYRADLSWDFQDGDSDPAATAANAHGTAIAGIAAARGDNNIGVSGAAPEASLAGLRLLGENIADLRIADALSYQNQEIDLYNNSWKPRDWFWRGNALSLAALETAATEGRNGLGNIYVFAAGNDQAYDSNVNYNSFANSRYTVAVAAIDDSGDQTRYSEPGASLLVSAYSKGSYKHSPSDNRQQLISDNGTQSFDLNVNNISGAITDLAVRLDIRHQRSSDLEAFLISPSGTRVELFTDVTDENAHFQGIWLSDEEETLITDWSNPEIVKFKRFRPEGRLADLDGETANGIWQLEITDNTPSQAGQLRNWQLDIGTNGITTTDLIGADGTNPGDYTYDSGGTSSAAPLVSGVVALMLEANPNLTWRDVQHILVETADPDKTDRFDEDWTTNGAGYQVNHKYGFGGIDAAAAVEKATTWTSVAEEVSISSEPQVVEVDIPNADGTEIERTINITDDITVEWAEVVFEADHPIRGDLNVVLVSPDGTESILAQPHPPVYDTNPNDNYNPNANYQNWVFTSVRHWGESSLGEWTLRVSDQIFDFEQPDTGTWKSWKLNLYGTQTNHPPTLTTVLTLTGATETKPFAITYADLANVADEADVDGDTIWFRIETVTSGTLIHNGNPVIPGETVLRDTDELVWIPDTSGSAVPAFTVKAFDGTDNSETPIQVDVEVTELPTITLNATDQTASEDGDTGEFTFTRSGNTNDPLTIHYSTTGTATQGTDYTTLSDSITIPAGETTFTLPITPINDTEYEGDETVVVNLIGDTDYQVGTANNAQVLIADNDLPPNTPPVATNLTFTQAYTEDIPLDLTNIGITDPDSGDTITVSLQLSHPEAGQLTTDTVGTTSSTFDPASGVWQASGAVADINTLLTDVQFVPTENFNGNLTLDTNVSDGIASPLTGTISLQGISVNDAPTVDAIASLTGATVNQPFTIAYSDLLNASNASDVEGDGISFQIEAVTSGTLTKNGQAIVPGVTTLTPTEELVWVADQAGESIPGFTVKAFDGSDTSVTTTQVVLDVAELPTVTLSATDANASEDGDTGEFTITRTGSTTEPLTVNFSLAGDAVTGDYGLFNPDNSAIADNSVTIPANASTTTINLEAINDTEFEENETVVLNLAAATGYQVGTANSGTVTIADNETPIVINTNDSSIGSLRYAIDWANRNPGLDTIAFNIPTADAGYDPVTGAFTIQPLSALPIITDPVVIDGKTQVGFSATPIIELDGSNVGERANGLTITAGNSTVRGLVINRFDDSGIAFRINGNNRIEGNFIGTDVTGTQALGNNLAGVYIDHTSNNTIGGTTPESRNLISGNSDIFATGIALNSSATGNVIQGNYIGTDITGTKDLGNFYGIKMRGTSNTLIGGTTTGAGNLISGNDAEGINIQRSSATNNVIQGNYIGTDVTGTKDLGNSDQGIYIATGSNNLIGGSTVEARNLISGNDSRGITLSVSTMNNVIIGNYIGTDITGTKALGNRGGVGIGGFRNILGGTIPEERNLISGNDWDGVSIRRDIRISEQSGTQNVVQGNYIGTDVTGIQPLGNQGEGVTIEGADNTIGGTDLGAGNIIAFNNSEGIWLLDPNTVQSERTNGNAILGNSIFSNTQLGIDIIGSRGVTANDLGDGDVGANNLQNFPVLTSATSSGNSTTIQGTLNSTPNDTFRLEFFSNSSLDPSGYGEGETFLGFQDVTTDSSGNANFTLNLPEGSVGQFITATATDPDNNTSEFSQGIGVEQVIPELFTDIDAGLTNFWNPQTSRATAWGDYDNDGDLDILLSNGNHSKVYENTGSGFTEINAGLAGVLHGSVAWGDYDNDNDLDILLTGYDDDSDTKTIVKIYENTGSGFTDINTGLNGVRIGSATWGDYDNDGDLDILMTGFTYGSPDSNDSDRITKVYENTGNGFMDIGASLLGLSSSSVDWGDYDSDGDLDILLTGWEILSFDSAIAHAKVYENTGNGFTDINAGLTGVHRGSGTWGDYDGDGDLDILLTGWKDESWSNGVAKVYENTGSGFTDINAGLTNVGHSSAVWGDYDNDGDLDILLTGAGASNDGQFENLTKVYENTGSGFTDINAPLTNVMLNSAVWGDYDNDGDLDILLAGHDGSDYIGKVYRNNTLIANTTPTLPTGLNDSVNGNSVTLNWNPSTDTETPQSNLTYNLRVGTTPGGSDIMSPMSNSDGTRQLAQMGNVNHNTSWTLNDLEPGTYYWSVQAVDSAFKGSAFADEGSFTIDSSGTTIGFLSTSINNNIEGTLNGTPNTNFLLEFFFQKIVFFTSGPNKISVGSTEVTTDSNGEASFVFVPTSQISVPSGYFLSVKSTQL
ncbi:MULTISPECIES: S8 family serine peptidase [unclassified Coleofasciculus]|uniref:S8 family serine peptidase n=1 Tax=unclassified Coleofasciculus TaxID=2692782 RepID=UPI001882AF3A|nr:MULTISPECIES: S8 family serine peptidase [unclassified Coleofasciculus]MBE9128186.1 proprotein convertase P-domain-containing protein [Coleofasciculus sp. LEGE 07081]MBE9151256.1 proprotein convertase P-domain-containing protein [Coleofasciculus sp. LEGE 07092]